MASTSRWSGVALLAVLGVAACSSSGAEGGSLTGSVAGEPLVVADAISVGLVASGNIGAEIELTTTAGACDDATANVAHPGERVVLVLLADSDPPNPGGPVGVGAYAIDASSTATRAALFEVNALDATCANNADNEVLGGTGGVTLTAVHGDVLTGSFDVTLDSGEHVTGTFDPAACSALLDKPSAPPTCE